LSESAAAAVETGPEEAERDRERERQGDPVRIDAATAAQTQKAGRWLGDRLQRGDLVILSGELGAGKTTFTQGLAEGLGVRGPITSPTFVIARVHPSVVGGPPLVHVDAYRLGSLAELDDLDLDTSVEESVTVVEWGEGKAEVLSGNRIEVRIERALADDGARGKATGAGAGAGAGVGASVSVSGTATDASRDPDGDDGADPRTIFISVHDVARVL
jgi:tRNA threonylcarbamoyladenosine biosynthesis protein TsaE